MEKNRKSRTEKCKYLLAAKMLKEETEKALRASLPRKKSDALL